MSFTTGEIIGPGLIELAIFIRGIDQRLAVGSEVIDAIGDIALMLRDQLLRGLIGEEIDKEDVGIRVCALFRQRQPAPIGRQARNVLAVILEDQLARIISGLIGIEVIGLWVALIGLDIEGVFDLGVLDP